jgi:hypothetical protein
MTILRMILFESKNGGWQANVQSDHGPWTVETDSDPAEAMLRALRVRGASGGPAPLVYERMRDLRLALAGALPAPGDPAPGADPLAALIALPAAAVPDPMAAFLG